ncbi:MAG: RidA family protein [Sneathiella sp.]|nr:RidA family protein [Sneathiella sp.]
MKTVKYIMLIGALMIINDLANNKAVAQNENMTLKVANSPDLYDPIENGYSHAIVAKGGSAIAYLAGQGGENKTGELSTEFGDQVRQAYANLNFSLIAVGAKPDQVTKLTTYVVGYNQSMLEVMTAELIALFGSHLPAQTLVPVPRLALDGMLFEVDAVAVLK